MFFKISKNNVKRSFKDYAIYFLTLTFGVCIFYSFNSIESQKALFSLNSGQSEIMTLINNLISGISVFISFVLCGLILYANNFLIKKRKKEFAIYMTLGMKKSEISKILLFETFIIGLISLIVGLFIGVILSQGLSVLTAKMFEIPMVDYKFIISVSAILKTILYFSIIFIFAMIFNVAIISKYKLIDMINSSKKSESVKIRNNIFNIILFILSIIILVLAYYCINKSGLNINDIRFKLAILLGVIGTFMFYFGLAGFILYIVNTNKNIYFKNLNIFVSRQIYSKVNTNFISMSLICLMLFFTVTILSTGISLKSTMEKSLETSTPFDASGYMFMNEDSKLKNMNQALNELNFNFNEGENVEFYNEYRIEFDIDNILKNADESTKRLVQDRINEVSLVKISDYNNILKLKNKEKINLKDNEVMITSNFNTLEKTLNKFIKEEDKIKLSNKEYNISNKELLKESLNNSTFFYNICTIIVPDNVVDNMKPSSIYINVNYPKDNKDYFEEKYNQFFKQFTDNNTTIGENGIFILGDTKCNIYAQNRGASTLIIYLGIYIGVVFLISSAAILALQQLSDISESLERYKSLKRIGVPKKMINKTIFVQVFIYFMIPLGLALIHSVIGIHVINDYIKFYGKSDIGRAAISTVALILVIYGGYFYTTVVGYKNTINNAK
ncbi:ABC transporter permease [Clostridium botulinum]|uniref:ABC transporter permease n=1 Tax=Clostridium botulinum TaxID=1491 RepID=A0A6B4I1Z9_CLOBO|nr:FtsX-like permease family protein [Clostridium botulinum]EES47824.1 ABC transporter, permease protein [Clostridium botulinum E1 str. 'BoNT E Beluga']MBN1043652.1 ABC transporter permease [Clostridium botulinum]MBN1072638.1 ABC transporter permease [Clostridium botulinum]MBY6762773.1 FtsX-like permease family protein [Clostridium botulinum]MBY6811733.1 FtsX-like permease family protein [Clostridium botulinum]